MVMRKIIIGAIILSIIGAGFFLTRQEVKEIVEDGTDSWKTYRSEEYGFEARYPEDWIVKEDTFANEINFGEEKMKLFKVGFTVAFYQNQSELWGNETKSLSLEDWISKTFLPLKEGEVKKFSTFGVGNYEGFLVKKFKSVGVAKLTTRIFI
jgi:hypothetical protein